MREAARECRKALAEIPAISCNYEWHVLATVEKGRVRMMLRFNQAGLAYQLSDWPPLRQRLGQVLDILATLPDRPTETWLPIVNYDALDADNQSRWAVRGGALGIPIMAGSAASAARMLWLLETLRSYSPLVESKPNTTGFAKLGPVNVPGKLP